MSTNIEKHTLLEKILGSEIVSPRSNDMKFNDGTALNIISNDLYNSLAVFFNSSAPFFQTNIPIDRIIKYKDGTFSSMEKSIKGGISQHQGFDIINSIDIAQKLMSNIMPNLNRKLVSIYSDIINQNNYYLEQVRDILIVPEISKLKSIAEFIKDVSDEIEQISKSNVLSIATLTNIQQRRIDLKQTFYTFLSRLHQAIDSPFFDPQNIANSYLTARYALSNYIVSLVLENIVTGNLDDDSIDRMKNKIEQCFQELNKITLQLSQILQQRIFSNSHEINNINSFFQWPYDYMTHVQLNNLHNQNINIDNLKKNTLQYFDINLELQRIDQFIKSRGHSLNIVILPKDS